MSETKSNSFVPLRPMPPSDDEGKESPAPMKDKVAMYASQIAHSATGASSNISPVPPPKNAVSSYGQLLTPAHGRLTPTVQGRIKAPPVCLAPSLKRVASGIHEFSSEGVCFLPKEAENCAEKAQIVGRRESNGANLEEMPLNVEKFDPDFSLPEAKAFDSSNSTVITTSTTSSWAPSTAWNEVSGVAAVAARKCPPLEEVRTDSTLHSEDENQSGNPPHGSTSTATPKTSMPQQLSVDTVGTLAALSTEFTDNLVKEKSSRQGRSLQRWLIHSPTEELVRQVAGTIPITRDGRIVLVSASRKTEWILPKGGWDQDETKEECAARETFEEGGLLGQLGGCLEPIDYESNKAKKRRLGKLGNGGVNKRLDAPVGKGQVKNETGGKGEGIDKAEYETDGPPLPKRAKASASMSPSGPQSTSSFKVQESSKPSDRNDSASSLSNKDSNHSTVPPPAMPIDPKNYSYVRMFLFPLYVTCVKSEWPEKGRLRKLVDIDEAIKIMKAENRVYFQRGLEMVKERGLHLLNPQGSPKSGTA